MPALSARCARLLSALVDPAAGALKPILPAIGFSAANRIVLIACGTAHYACHLASYWIEEFARLPVEVDIASEYRYRNRPLTGREIVIAVSQSGETADTLSALKALAGRVAARVAVVNVATSSIAREADAILDILAGPEIGVASTKAYSGQAMALLAIALKAARTDRLDEVWRHRGGGVAGADEAADAVGRHHRAPARGGRVEGDEQVSGEQERLAGDEPAAAAPGLVDQRHEGLEALPGEVALGDPEAVRLDLGEIPALVVGGRCHRRALLVTPPV
ncbi:hypothetical protein GCM10011358_12550 [Sinisalibacter lacisalsi]|uniref:Glutamine--fructose-6-phosphate aminotransferase [isomerizing] n=1 Tax=Sinisalibacter lacisalsi TaxID=1526570 RepID=A0ABQ1QKU9_9RHOB|nr:hypothetical protein GCM10011358_12550 [Sinisalibacter lacisalsi]